VPFRLKAVLQTALLALFVLTSSTALHAEELHSNGLGGGPWSDPTSWREKKIPGPEDDAVISRGDLMIFDRNDTDRVTCANLYIDPRGGFTFRTIGDTLCVLSGMLESYGAIKIDGTRTSDRLELRFIGKTPEQRRLKLVKGAALSVSGKQGLPEGRRNVAITSKPTDLPAAAIPTVLCEGEASTIMDVKYADLENIVLQATSIDNTGAKPNERINIVGNHFTGQGRINVSGCDTPLIADNLIELGVASYGESGILINASPLAEIRGNTVRGRWAIGIQGRAQVDSVVTDNTIEGCVSGLYWYGTNGMLKQLVSKKCDTGLICTSMTGVVDDFLADECKTCYNHAGATVQMSNFRAVNSPKDMVTVTYASGPLTLLNCDVAPEKIVLGSKALKKAKGSIPLVECLQYLVVKAKGKVPANAAVDVLTANPEEPLPSGAMDPNIRNSPTRLASNDMTPLPQTLEPLVVRSWAIDIDGEILAAPKYQVRVLAPPASPGQPAKPLAAATTQPDASWYRAEPNANKATLEIEVK